MGTLFLPPGSGPHPTIISLEGSVVIKEDLAAALASTGLAVLCLAFFRQPGLPQHYAEGISVEYLERGADWLLRQSWAGPGGLGVLGCSKGCDLALSMAAFLPPSKVRAVVAVNGCITSAVGPTFYRGKTIAAHGIR